MPRQTTYGYEAEFDVNATSVIHRLYELDLAGADHLHGYHCDCESCWFRNGWAFRGQTDSSCSGEIISDIMGSNEEYEQRYNSSQEWMLMRQLADAAVEVDAEPGLRSGFHVHVATFELSSDQLADSFYQYLRWEPTLTRVASARWAEQRQNNRAVRSESGYDYELIVGEPLSNRSLANHDLDSEFRHSMLQQHRRRDRHSNLNVGQRGHPTWEFRLWNSTRAAWRMAMFCDLSKAFMDPLFVRAIAEVNPPQRFRRPSAGINLLADTADHCGYRDLPERLLRQAYYLDEKAGEAPMQLTIG